MITSSVATTRPHHDWFRARGIGSMTAVPAASCKGSCSFTMAYLGRNDRLTGIGASSTASKRVVSQPASCSSDTWLTRKLPWDHLAHGPSSPPSFDRQFPSPIVQFRLTPTVKYRTFRYYRVILTKKKVSFAIAEIRTVANITRDPGAHSDSSE